MNPKIPLCMFTLISFIFGFFDTIICEPNWVFIVPEGTFVLSSLAIVWVVSGSFGGCVGTIGSSGCVGCVAGVSLTFCDTKNVTLAGLSALYPVFTAYTVTSYVPESEKYDAGIVREVPLIPFLE